MYKWFCFFLLGMSTTVVGQLPVEVTFEYDAAGNQVQRIIRMVKPREDVGEEMRTSATAPREEVTEEKVLETMAGVPLFSFYPNPVQEQLYVQWATGTSQQIVQMRLFSPSGQQLVVIDCPSGGGERVIDFSMYTNGLYVLELVYSTGAKEAIKIVKG